MHFPSEHNILYHVTVMCALAGTGLSHHMHQLYTAAAAPTLTLNEQFGRGGPYIYIYTYKTAFVYFFEGPSLSLRVCKP